MQTTGYNNLISKYLNGDKLYENTLVRRIRNGIQPGHGNISKLDIAIQIFLRLKLVNT